jgi:hypothetical protein
VPQFFLNIDREKVQTLNVPISSVFTTLQSYLGTNYVGDFNFLGRTYQVNLQGDAAFRSDPNQTLRMYTRNSTGGMVPMGSLMEFQRINGPDAVSHYNVYPAALIQGTTLPGVSSGAGRNGAICSLRGRPGRLPQRFPVRIQVRPDPGVSLRIGQTVSVAMVPTPTEIPRLRLKPSSALGGPPRDSPENGPPRQTIGLRTLHLADVHGKPINAAVGADDLVEHRGERSGVVFF